MWNFSTYDCECNKASKIDEYLDIKDCSWKKRVSGKSLLVCENQILNTMKPHLLITVAREVTCEKNNCLIYTISFVISASCCYYQIKYWLKKNMHYI